jgi:uncharacterized membrane protein YoaK (UPF0700 family)
MSRKLCALTALLFLILVVTSVFIYRFADERSYISAEVSLISCIIFPIMLFLFIFIEEIIDDWRVYSNPWVEEVEEMDYWFNPMFFAWLYRHDRKRWIKLTMAISLPFSFIYGLIIVWLITLNWATLEVLLTGFLVGAAFTTLLAIARYQRYQIKNENNIS